MPNCDSMATSVVDEPAEDTSMLVRYLNTGDKARDKDDAVEFVLPDLPESETSVVMTPLCNYVCRLCGMKSEEVVTRTESDLQDLTEKINRVVPLTVLQTDQMSKSICSTCCDKINFISEFIIACQETEKRLTAVENLANNPRTSFVNDNDCDNRSQIHQCPNCKINLSISRVLASSHCQCQLGVSKFRVELKNTIDSSVTRVVRRSNRNSRKCAVPTTSVSTRLRKLPKQTAKIRDKEERMNLNDEKNPSENGRTKLRDVRKRSLISGSDERVKSQKLDSEVPEQDSAFNRGSDLTERSREDEALEKSVFEYKCAVCTEAFPTESSLLDHEKSRHAEGSKNTEKPAEDGEDDQKTKSEKKTSYRKYTKLICDECGARFVLRERFEFHLERHEFGNMESFTCRICEKQFKSENILWDHHQFQHKFGERFACATCDKRFLKGATLNHHLKVFGHQAQGSHQTRNSEDGVKPRPKITCEECGARFVLKERYEFHMERHRSNRMDSFACALCGRESTNENVLWDHYQYMHKLTKRYACTTCGKLFHKQSTLARHQTRYGHKGTREIDVGLEGDPETVDSAAFKKVIAEDVVEMKSVNCVLCGAAVWGVDPNLINDAVSCTSCVGPGLSLQVDSEGAKVISRRQYHCNMCTKHFTTKDRLEYHVMRHSENMNEFVCSTCGKELSTEQALFEHYLFVHKGARPHVCELCGKSYQFKARLKEHMRSHSGERPFACEVCGQRCMTNNALRSHKKTHVVEKRFPCEICKKAFRRRQDLNEHLERHWKNDKTVAFPQVFNCVVCAEVFPTFRILKKHMKESHSVENQDPILSGLQPLFECEDCHEKFKHQMSLKVHRERAHEGKTKPVHHCDLCDVTYKNARVLSTHVKNKHRGGKRYKCAQCGKEYNQSTSLHNHILLHTGEKPFACEHCEMQFRTKESRDYHQRKHTGERPYKCPRCDESFATTTQRREHRKREHEEGNNHHCPECGKACFDEHGVRSHLTTHFTERLKSPQNN